MQLGTRWSVGTPPPASVSDIMTAVILDHEAAHPEWAGMTWTLTFLEGRPIAELDDGTTISWDAAGTAAHVTFPVSAVETGTAATPPQPEDDWDFELPQR